MKKDFYEKPIYLITNYIFSFLLTNIYFAFCNILLIVFYIVTALSPSSFNLFMLFICLIPLGPSISTLYSTLGKAIVEKDIFFSSHFWNFYKTNFISNLKLWLIELFVLAVLIIDFQYFYFNIPQTGIYVIFATLTVIAILVDSYSFSINSKFNIKLKNLLLLSFYYSVKKFHISILKILVIILAYMELRYISIIFVIFIPTIIVLIFYIYDKNILNEIESKFLNK